MEKKPSNLLLAIATLGGIALVTTSQGNPIVYEGGNYLLDSVSADPDNGLNGGTGLPATNVGGNPTGTSTGLRGNWGTEHKVVPGLTYSTLSVSGGAIKRSVGNSWSPSNPFVYRDMTTDPFAAYRNVNTAVLGWNGNFATDLYYSVLLNSSVNTGTNNFVFKIGLDNNDSNTFIAQSGTNWITNAAAGSGGTHTFGTAIPGETVMIVGRMRFESAKSLVMDYWFNPSLGQPLPDPEFSRSYTTALTGGQFRSLQTRVDAADVLTFDEFRVGTNASSVMPVAGAIIPNAPSSLAATAPSFAEVQLNWADNSNDELEFVIERSLTGTDGWRQIAVAAPGATSYSDTSVVAVTTYHYRILAANGGGESAFSANASVTTPPAQVATPPPSGLAANADSFSEISLSWMDNSSDETSFVIERSPDGATEWTAIATLPTDTMGYQNVGLTAETTYHYRVIANAPGGASVPSNVISATTSALPPETPVNFKLSFEDPDGTIANSAAIVPGVLSYFGGGTILTSAALSYSNLNSLGNGFQSVPGRYYIKLDTTHPDLARYVSGGQIGGSGLGVLYVRWLASAIEGSDDNPIEFRTNDDATPATNRAFVGPNGGIIRIGAAATQLGGNGQIVSNGLAPSAGTDLYVVKFTFDPSGNTRMDLFVNQTTEGTPNATATGAIKFNTIDFFNFGSVPHPALDEFRIGSSYETVIDAGPQTAGFASWAVANGVTGGTGGDSDGDGIVNALEYGLVTNLTGSNGSLGTFNGSLLSYTKRQDAITNGDVTYVIETSPDLMPPWTPQVTQNPGNSEGTISYTIPTGAAKVFARLKVLVPE